MKSEPDSPSSVGVMDRSRLLLCALTFFCLSLNPLPSLLGSDASGSPGLSTGHGPSRILFGFPNHTHDFGEQPRAHTLATWTRGVNALFLLSPPCSVVAALPPALGDGVGAERGGSRVGLRPRALPVGARHAAALAQVRVVLETPQTSRPASQKGERRRVDIGSIGCLVLAHDLICPRLSSVLQGDYTSALASLETCLSVLTRALPTTGLDLVCSLSWNLIRYCLHRPVPLGWLVHQVRGKHEGEEAKTSARDAALVYHQLSQLQLTGWC